MIVLKGGFGLPKKGGGGEVTLVPALQNCSFMLNSGPWISAKGINEGSAPRV